MSPSSRKPRSVVLPTANAGALKPLADTFKTESRLLGAVERFVMGQEPDERDQKVLHPSEICKTDWCQRQSFYALTNAPAMTLEQMPSFVRENIFAEGHDIGRKWQDRWWAMGVLRGEWVCLACTARWSDTAPQQCPKWGGGKNVIRYAEVPLYNAEHNIGGHADGDINDSAEPIEDQPLIEIKSVGLGTVRMENPELLAKHTHKVDIDGHDKTLIDYNALWRDIKRPFPVHLRQGCLYCFLSGRKRIVFIYECKWNQQPKEFVVTFRPGFIERVLEDCKDVMYFVGKAQAPPRPLWANKTHTSCKGCRYYQTCYSKTTSNGATADGRASSEEAAAPQRRIVRRSKRSTPAVGASAPAPTPNARRRDPESAKGSDRAVSKPTDGAVRSKYRLAELSQWSARDSGDR